MPFSGNLDEETAKEILELLKKSAHDEGRCVIMVTHSSELAKEADVVCRYENKTFLAEVNTQEERKAKEADQKDEDSFVEEQVL